MKINLDNAFRSSLNLYPSRTGSSQLASQVRDILQQLAQSSFQPTNTSAPTGMDPSSQRLPNPMVLGLLLGAVARLSQLASSNNPSGTTQGLPSLMNRLPTMAAYANGPLASAVNGASSSMLAANGSAPWMSLLPPGWTPDQPITLDPSRAFDVNYMKQVMAQTAVVSSIQQGKPLPSQADMENAYQYWIPKMQTIGGNGLDGYWLGRLLQPPDSGSSSQSYADTASVGSSSSSISSFGGESPAVADAAAAGAFSDAPSADEQKMLDAISDPAEKARMELQLKLQKQAEISSMISNILNIKHQTSMSIIGNIR